ncbi:MAG: hypothetical protein NC485_13920 [Ruminococcus flavefaciens]|nr:hypothetical protein [Ruminococcus flavefaciens]MCM1062572.1 hypothetical protein [Eubacterium sp.]
MFYRQLKQACKSNNTSITAVLKKIGIGTANGTYWKNGSVPSSDIVVQLSEFLNVSTDYLLKGKEKSSPMAELTNDEQEMLLIYKGLSDISKAKVKERAIVLSEIESPVEQVAEEDPEEQETIFIEFATLKASAGTGEQLTDDPERDFIEVVKNDTTLQAKFAIQIHGDSMEPEYNNGDIVLVKAQPQINIGQIGIFTVNDMGYIKKLGKDRLISLNPDYEDIYFKEGQEIRCKGLVIGTLEEDDFV